MSVQVPDAQRERIIRAIKQIAERPTDRAKSLQVSERQQSDYETGKAPSVYAILYRFEQAGVIQINDPAAHTPTCNCQADQAA